MGLDIFVNRLRRKYNNVNDFTIDFKKFQKKVDEEWNKSNLSYEKLKEKLGDANPRCNEELAYFRKVNFLYGWFEKHNGLDDDECFSIFTKQDIADLIETCKEVLDHHQKDKDEGVQFAKDNLPTCEGFFFGYNDYGEYYWGDVQDVIEKFTNIYNEATDDDQFVIEFNY